MSWRSSSAIGSSIGVPLEVVRFHRHHSSRHGVACVLTAPAGGVRVLEPPSRGVERLVNGHTRIPMHAVHFSFLEVLGQPRCLSGVVLRWFVFNHDRRAVRDGELYRDMKVPSIAVMAMGHLHQHSA